MTSPQKSKGNLNHALATVELEYGTLAEGVSVTGRVCPACNGGQSAEGSFAATRKGNLVLYKCHRASCDFEGVVTLHGSAAIREGARVPLRKDGRRRYAALGKEQLPPDVSEFLESRYEIGPYLQAKGALRWTGQHSPPGHGRLVLPIMDCAGYPEGYVARKLDKQDGKKSLTFAEEHGGSWYFNRRSGSKPLVIVEDQLSALKASQYVNSVALLGTNLSETTLKGILDGRYTEVYIALDPDAFPLSIRIAVALRPRLKLTVLRIPKDIKDMKASEIFDFFVKHEVI